MHSRCLLEAVEQGRKPLAQVIQATGVTLTVERGHEALTRQLALATQPSQAAGG